MNWHYMHMHMHRLHAHAHAAAAGAFSRTSVQNARGDAALSLGVLM